MFIANEKAQPAIHAAAVRMAVRCRYLVQCCLREEEWGDADREFYLVIREEFEQFMEANRRAAGVRSDAWL